MLINYPDRCMSPNPDLYLYEACIDIYNNFNEIVHVSGQYDECDGCTFQNLATLAPGSNTSILISTRYALHINYSAGETPTCESKKFFYDRYRYGWNLTEKCNPIYVKESADCEYLLILNAIMVLITFYTLWYTIKYVYKCETFRRYTKLENDLRSATDTSTIGKRIKSIDVFRGLCIVLMIFVNYGGGSYSFFFHIAWNGLKLADLLFPWFLWLMGMSFRISLYNKLCKGVPHRRIFIKIFCRSLILILLGLSLNLRRSEILTGFRWTGVLQHTGVTYLIVGVLEVTFAKRNEFGRLEFLKDIIVAAPQWIIVCILVFIHTIVTFGMEVPNCGRGYLGPGGLHDLARHVNCTGGAAGYIDRVVFGKQMANLGLNIREVYETTVHYDLHGIFGILNTVLLVYLGVQAGRILHTYSDAKSRIIRWVTWGVITVLIAGILAGFSKNDGVIPINKNLSSLSFVLFLGGMAFLIEACLFVIVDLLRKWEGRPFIYPGMNSLFLYVGQTLTVGTFPFAWTPINRNHTEYLNMHLWAVGLWVVISVIMYKQNVFLTI